MQTHCHQGFRRSPPTVLISRLVLLLMVLCIHPTVHANPTTDALGKCLSDNTNGKERKDLAKWIFVAMSAHPEVGQLAQASPQAIESAQRTIGVLVTRLISGDCPSEMRAVVKAVGTEGIRISFEHLGRMAMHELMSDPQVNQAIGGFERYVDKAKVEPVLSSQ